MANDHFIPQFYLRNFEIPTRKKWIFSYRRGLSAKPRAIRSVACSGNFYTMKSDIEGVDKEQLDKLLSDIESYTAPIIQNLLATDKMSISAEEHEMLSMFLAYLANRTPRSLERLRKLDSAMRLQLTKLFASNKEAFEHYAKKAGVADDPELLEEMRQMGLEADKNFTIEYEGPETEDWFMGNAVSIADSIIPLIQAKHLSLIESSSSRVFFVTSDHPVVLIRPDNYPAWRGVGFQQAMLLVPISPNRCLFLTNERLTNKVIQLKRDEVADLNSRVIRAAHESIFSHAYAREVEVQFNETKLGENNKVHVS